MTEADAAHHGVTTEPIRVLIVDDHEVMAASLARVLDDEPDVVSVGMASTLAQARARVQSSAPDVLVLDRRLPDGDGVEAIRDLKALRPSMNILVLTGSSSDDVLVRGAGGRCRGLPLQDAQPGRGDLGRPCGGSGRGIDLLRDARPPAAEARPGSVRRTPTLTRREEEVLAMLAQGLSNAAIAAELTVSVNTVRNHVSNLSAKLGAHSKLEAMSIAIQRGLLAPPQ